MTLEVAALVTQVLPNGNLVKQNESFYEGYGKATYTVNDRLNFGGSIWGSPSVLNSGASGIYYTANATLTAPAALLPNGIGAYVSADFGWWQLGTTDPFYGVPAFPGGIPTRATQIGTPASPSPGKRSRLIFAIIRAT